MIVVMFTGGTISMRYDPAAKGAVPALAGRDILDLVPQLREIADLEVDDFGTHPGPHMTPERMWQLRERVAALIARSDVDGIVVTHGTDSLEETANLLARSLVSEKPIVFTGAMRTSMQGSTSQRHTRTCSTHSKVPAWDLSGSSTDDESSFDARYRFHATY